ncbi:protoporphyrinogen/coproporphyrinogen oxidase [Candidatus Avelusimicrobium stercoris]|uniref:protoporphyrinogen/coproporphyrinogen oxidase n=1 Tax=Candidatus Avelusimicrobium stercoris TaxID=1947924 RepID=UPI003D11E12F
MHVKTLILGAGLTGLSTAYHLEKAGQTDYLLAEKESTPGGLCKSQVINGCTFDFSGHLLHLHTKQGKQLVKSLLGANLRRLKRRAWIYTGSARVPFPFQANLFALPEAERQQCVNGLLACAQTPKTAPKNFKEWCLNAFGPGVYQVFMRPYNTKLWGRDPQEMTCDWCGSFVPTPTVDEVLKSAVKPPTKSYGYNAYFYYPARGGCGALTDALTRSITHLSLNTPVTRVDLTRKTAQCKGKTISFDYLVNTLPLPELLRLTGEAELAALADKLVHTQVAVYNFAIKRQVKPFSWIYFPDKQDPFYRIGLQSGFSPVNAPKGVSAFYVELPGDYPHTQAGEARIWKALAQKGIIKESDDVLFSFWQSLPYAYAVYDKFRASAVSQALKALAGRGCFCAGRYGKWEYSFMEKSLLEGLELAKKLV